MLIFYSTKYYGTLPEFSHLLKSVTGEEIHLNVFLKVLILNTKDLSACKYSVLVCNT